MAVVNIQLPPLHEGRNNSGGQLSIFNDPSRFKVIVCGRRWGKTTLGVVMCLRTSIKGGRTWWVAPTYKIANEGWDMLKRLARQIPDVEIKEGDKKALFPGGGSIEIRSADIVGSLRGAGLDGLVLDEFAECRESTWTEELRAALSDKLGWAVFIGTPKGKNWAYHLYHRASLLKNWSRFSRPTLDNPFIVESELDDAKEELPINIFKQEYEADFGASQLQVYPDFDRVFHAWTDELPEFDFLMGGLDFGGTSIGSHKSAGGLAGYNSTKDMLILLRHFEESGPNIAERQLNWMWEAEAAIKLQQALAGYKQAGAVWRADKTQMGFIQALRSSGFSVLSSKGGKDSVTSGIELVQRRIKVRGDGKARFYYLPGLTTFAEAMERYRYPEFKEGEDKIQSQNPLKVNDDTVDMFRYLVEGVDRMVIGDPMELYKNTLPVLV